MRSGLHRASPVAAGDGRGSGWDLRWGDVGRWFLVYYQEGGIAILLAMLVTDRI
jgi:hypothetical protein